MVRLIITTGLSAAGKSTISRLIADELSLPAVYTSDIMRKYAKSLGYERLLHFFSGLGYQKAYDAARPIIFDEVKNYAKGGGVVLDGLHDYELYRNICNEYGRENIKVLAISATRKYRVERHAERKKLTKKEAEKDLDRRDEIAIVGGTQKIINGCDFEIKNETTLKECIKEIIKHV